MVDRKESRRELPEIERGGVSNSNLNLLPTRTVKNDAEGKNRLLRGFIRQAHEAA